MAETIENRYVELSDGGYYVAGCRVSLASVIYAFRQGASPETILQEFPAIESLPKVYGAITFVLENPEVVETYLANQERLWEEFENTRPIPPDMLERFEKGRKLLKRQPA